MPISPGTRLGPYEITAPVGAGGMGEVYRAVDTRLDRAVAVKILPSEFARDAQLKLRFEREAKVISSLTHPNICTLHDVGESDGVHYLVMELLDGETLAQRLTRGPLPVEQVLRIGIEIASALEKAHRQGIVHRDLKPANIMLTKSGVKLLDFGLAKAAGAIQSPAFTDATEQKPLTAEGTILGTFQYMAPEQLEGVDTDARSDIFAFGAVLYEMATGRRAFEGKTKTSLIAAIVQSQPAPISTIQPLTPPALDRLILACLEKDPDDRVQTAHDVRLQLRWIADAGSAAGVAAPVVQRKARRQTAGVAVALLTVAAVAGIAGWTWPRKDVTASYTFSIPNTDGRYRDIAGLYLSPDGSKLMFGADDAEGNFFCWIRPLDSAEATPVLATKDHSGSAFWSSDGKSLLFYRDRKLMRAPISGGPAQPIVELPAYRMGTANADGVMIIAQGEAPLTRVDAESGAVSTITTLDAAAGEFSHMAPQFLPDGKRFLFIGTLSDPRTNQNSYRLYAGQLGSKDVRSLGPIPSAAVYTEPGYLLYVRDGALLAQPFDAQSLRFKGEARSVAPEVAVHYVFGSRGAFSVAPNGVLAVRPPRVVTRLYRVDASGRVGEPVGPIGSFYSHRVSPDGSQVAVCLLDETNGTSQVWVYGLDRPTRQRLTFDNTWHQFPVWSRDGSRVFYGTDRRGYPDIYEKSVAQGSEDRLVVSAALTQMPQDVTIDGSTLLFRTNERRAGNDLWLQPLRGEGKARPFLTGEGDQRAARFSPNGRFVAYASNESGAWEVYVAPFPAPGAVRQISTSAAVFTRVPIAPLWSADGRRLFYNVGREIMVVEVSPETGSPTSTPKRLFELPAEGVYWDILPDGGFLVAMDTESSNAPPVRVVTNWTRLLQD